MLPRVCMLIWLRDNYSKPTWGLARLRFTYPWFKTLHFAHLYFNSLPTSPSKVKKTHFYSKLEHNTYWSTWTHSLFLTNPRNAKIPVDSPFCIWYWHSIASVNLDEQQVVWGTEILVRNQSLFGFLLWACGCFIVFLSNQSMVNITCNGMRILVVFVDVYEKCDHLFFGFVFFYGHFVCCGHCVLQWTQVSIGFKF